MASTERKTDGRKTARPTPEIPDKLYFRIGEVARLLDLPAYVLRFWESEFPQLKPGKGGTGQRLYRRRDVETALEIRRLLYDEGYTIPGARQYLKTEPRNRTAGATAPVPVPAPEQPPKAEPLTGEDKLLRLKNDLRELSSLLGNPPAGAPAALPTSRRTPAANHRGLHVAPRRRAAADEALPLFGPPPTDE